MRLPRKRKKQVKKLVAKKTASKMAMCSLVTAQSMAHNALILATPSSGPTSIAEKTVSVAQNVMRSAKVIQSIMLEPPNSWRDFVR